MRFVLQLTPEATHIRIDDEVHLIGIYQVLDNDDWTLFSILINGHQLQINTANNTFRVLDAALNVVYEGGITLLSFYNEYSGLVEYIGNDCKQWKQLE